LKESVSLSLDNDANLMMEEEEGRTTRSGLKKR
jgi:hypothetical protein